MQCYKQNTRVHCKQSSKRYNVVTHLELEVSLVAVGAPAVRGLVAVHRQLLRRRVAAEHRHRPELRRREHFARQGVAHRRGSIAPGETNRFAAEGVRGAPEVLHLAEAIVVQVEVLELLVQLQGGEVAVRLSIAWGTQKDG